MPLVYDLSIAKKTKTSLQIPDIEFRYPEDVRGHIEMGFETAEKIFGKNVSGIWPAEGSISNEILDMLVDYNIKWIGADEQILHNTDVADKKIHSAYFSEIMSFQTGLDLFTTGGMKNLQQRTFSKRSKIFQKTMRKFLQSFLTEKTRGNGTGMVEVFFYPSFMVASIQAKKSNQSLSVLHVIFQ
jgi:alpha-amylase/alpha-mannosidase (GH57 family)